ncbi:hypothetical protein [Streptomyces paromomycinus]|uniref:Uncharacterized protein n=1 Tax=Streptomyces paromomycinus TaxID=92743 RepID=A0A401W799_STREY|nr:hypothetical protein [Streptomyces paromomycinus]GCD45213.1 hypothetical protein GKJPGBOP_04935 [Streptomyces paromomycinus]
MSEPLPGEEIAGRRLVRVLSLIGVRCREFLRAHVALLQIVN